MLISSVLVGGGLTRHGRVYSSLDGGCSRYGRGGGASGRGDGRALSTAWTIVGISSFVKGSCTLPFFEGQVEGATLLLDSHLHCG